MSSLTTNAFRDWLVLKHKENYNYDLLFNIGRIPDLPNRAASITKNNSPKTIMNGLFEEIIFRIQTRGSSNNNEDSEKIAKDVLKILDHETMFDIEDCYVLSIICISRPRLLNLTDPESRFNYTADYRVTASTD